MSLDRAKELSDRFKLIDTNGNGTLEVSELQSVFGEHATEFLKFCDGDGDKQLTNDEFVNGITEDCKDMDDADFQTNWLDRMSEAIAAAQPGAGGDAAITK